MHPERDILQYDPLEHWKHARRFVLLSLRPARSECLAKGGFRMSQHSCKNCSLDHVDSLNEEMFKAAELEVRIGDLERALKAPFTPEQIGDLFDQYGLRCVACGRDTVTQLHFPKQELESGCCASPTEPEGIPICAYCWVEEFEALKTTHEAELKSLADEYEASSEVLRKEVADLLLERTRFLNERASSKAHTLHVFVGRMKNCKFCGLPRTSPRHMVPHE